MGKGGRAEEELIIAALKGSSLFSGLNERQLVDLTELAEMQDFEPNHMVIRDEDNVNDFYLIAEGQVEVRRSDGRPPVKLGPGQFFGETTLVSDSTRSAGVMALRRTTCLVLSGSELRSYPAVALKLLQELNRSSREPAPTHAKETTVGARVPAPSVTDEAIEFKSEKTKLLLDSLVRAFTEDYMVRRRYFEQSGWRTFGELSAATKISHTTLYGKRGSYGPNVDELLSRGLIEMRVFTGERGRGGEIVRARIAYDKEPVKRYVDQAILKRK